MQNKHFVRQKITSFFMVWQKVPAFMNSEHLDVTYTQYPCPIKSYMTGYNKDDSWVTQTSWIQLNGVTGIPRSSNIVHV